MTANLARSAFVIVVLVAVGATVFRVSTAPERVAQRREVARTVCLSTGGEWVSQGRDGVCRRSAP